MSTVGPCSRRVPFAVKGPEEHGSCLGAIEHGVKVTGEASDEGLGTIHKLCNHSPVHGMLAESIAIKGAVTRG